MDMDLPKELAEAIGFEKLKPFGVNEEKTRWSSMSLDLARMNNATVRELNALVLGAIAKNPKVKGGFGARRDLALWIECAEKGVKGTKCKTTKHFAAMAYEWLQSEPRHWLFAKDDDRDCMVAWYVKNIEHVPRQVRREQVIPAHTKIYLLHMEMGSVDSSTLTFWQEDIEGRTAAQAFQDAGWFSETPELAARYKLDVDRYIAFHDKIGKQFLATGIGTSNLYGNEGGEDSWRSRYYSAKTIVLDKDGEASRVVIDVRRESDSKPDKERTDSYNRRYWRGKSFVAAEDSVDPDEVGPEDQDEDLEGEEDTTTIDDIPLFPTVPVFHLVKHMRLRVHIANLAEYVYSATLGDKLVLPDEERELINMLVAHKGGFKDIIGKKGGGAIVLCCGIPGVGKTLTSEVYAEVMSKALYSVQCSQLGTDEEELEKSLLQVFARAERWGAILLLDECDVYVAARGDNIKQNAIVGVFLRVLEYYQGVLFMTTNRADLVDDAIASRCLARVEYKAPDVESQKKIWRILATNASIELPMDVINEFAAEHPNITGRDVKQLLKLASMVAKVRGTPITAETLRFVRRFKPTTDEVAANKDAPVNPLLVKQKLPGFKELVEKLTAKCGATADVKYIGGRYMKFTRGTEAFDLTREQAQAYLDKLNEGATGSPAELLG